ncbi:protein rodD [Aspergillus clavatus NRRL 1]|uniref:PQ loop repeat protein n=1 Tax=Aspergillus clavatus (strain ATCC 1007 / CBS 513.65 / DSM 816 / NCTC 3887 / NRRL 1 / QM 1276 / 107) TaxID=344612 RepID=A1C5J5_ASPCL|nr:PQ loop repeat protein [Aspergillus clavatus NRRL 1]EAW14963.1 PQ loop repeat protein [Aspergillus clavatus NRRL 1]
MKVFVSLLLLATVAMAAVDTTNAGCSQPGQYCNGGTFLCCNNRQCDLSKNVLIPQIVINYRRHDTEGLQASMMLLWAVAGVPLGVYNIVKDFNIALRIQPQILTTLSLVTWAQCLYYGKKYPIFKCIAAVAPLLSVLGGVEVGLVYALRAAQNHELEWPLILMAVLSAGFLAAGVLTHYWDIYVHRTVRGISFLFVGIDAAGDLFSLVSCSNLVSTFSVW